MLPHVPTFFRPDRQHSDRDAGGWTLTLPRPRVWRMEYRLELRHPDGGREEICDPANPLRAPGAFGEKSVLELPDYRRPSWLVQPTVDGAETAFSVPSRYLRAEV